MGYVVHFATAKGVLIGKGGRLCCRMLIANNEQVNGHVVYCGGIQIKRVKKRWYRVV